jgi:hypothetical protein
LCLWLVQKGGGVYVFAFYGYAYMLPSVRTYYG